MINSILQALSSFLDWLIDGIKHVLGSFFCWIYDNVLELLNVAIDPILSKIPDLSTNTEAIVMYASWANKWVDLELGLLLFGVWFGVAIALNVINWILGIIPTVN